MNFSSLSYELGVMMFNVVIKTVEDNYDMEGNFEGIVNSVSEKIDKSKMQEGFIAESKNHDAKNAVAMFEDAYELYLGVYFAL